MKQLKKSIIQWIFVIALCLWLGFSFGVFKQTILENSLASVKSQLQSVTLEKVSVAKKLASIEAAQVADTQTIKGLTEENKALHEQLNAMTNKLYFYQRVVSPELLTHGVQVYSFSIEKSIEDDLWHYELVLMQSQKRRPLLSGKFTLSFTYQEGDQLKQMTLAELNKNAHSTFKFRYFQTLDGEFKLPVGLTVEEVILNLKVSTSKQKLELHYDWNSLIADESSDRVDLE